MSLFVHREKVTTYIHCCLCGEGVTCTTQEAFERGNTCLNCFNKHKTKFSIELEYKKISDSFFLSSEWKEIREVVFAKFGHRCLQCGSKKHLQIDHIIPRYKNINLQYSLDNLQPLCAKCNKNKGIRTIDLTKNFHKKQKRKKRGPIQVIGKRRTSL
jgi:5-methylcytosine-specific restriction endonuclease McrA